MPLESATYISDLNASNPAGTDQKATADDHIRLLKSTVKATFPNVSGAVTPTHTELNYVDGVTSAIQTQLDAKQPLDSDLTAIADLASNGLIARTGTGTAAVRTITAPAAGISVSNGDGVSGNPTLALANDLSALEGLGSTGIAVRTASDTWAQRSVAGTSNEISVSNGDGVSGNPTVALASTLDLTGKTVTVATQTTGDNSTKAASTAFVQATSFAAALPNQTGNSGKFVTTDGSSASWSLVPLATGVSGTLPVANGGTGATDLTGLLKGNGTSAFTAAVAGTDYQAVLVSGTNIKTINSTSLLGSGDVAVQATLVSGTNIKTINGSSVLGSGDLLISTGSVIRLSEVTASSSATVDVETTFNSTYDVYMLVGSGLTFSDNSVQLLGLMKIGGSYVTSGYDFHTTTLTNSASTYAADVGDGVSQFLVFGNASNAAGANANFVMYIYHPASTSFKKTVHWDGAHISSTGTEDTRRMSGVASNSGTSALTGIRFYASVGTIAAGSFRLYGIKNS